MEALLAELLATLGAEEVLSMPGFFQSGHAFLKEKTSSANEFVTKSLAEDFERKKEYIDQLF